MDMENGKGMGFSIMEGQEKAIGDLIIFCGPVAVKRMPYNEETGEGGGEALSVELRLRSGDEREVVFLTRDAMEDPWVDFGGYRITFLGREGDSILLEVEEMPPRGT